MVKGGRESISKSNAGYTLMTPKQKLAHEHNFLHFLLAGMQTNLSTMQYSPAVSPAGREIIQYLYTDIGDLRADIRKAYIVARDEQEV